MCCRVMTGCQAIETGQGSILTHLEVLDVAAGDVGAAHGLVRLALGGGRGHRLGLRNAALLLRLRRQAASLVPLLVGLLQ